MSKSRLEWLRLLVGLVLILASMSWCFFILDILAEAPSFYSLDLLFSKPTGELLSWWQMLFRFLILVGIFMLIIGLSVSVMGAISLAEIYILCYLLKQHDLRFIFDGVQDIKYFRRLIPRSLKRQLDDEEESTRE